jgi:regulator of protease activity HflC (stomatin/prohibitin superfamily)
MHPFATHLITFLIGGIVAVLYSNHTADERAIDAFEDGRQFERDKQAEKDSARATKAAQTRRSKAHAS